MDNKLKIVSTQIQTDLNNITKELEGDIDWESIIEQRDRLILKMNDWIKIAGDLIEKAETRGIAQEERQTEDEYYAEQAEAAKKESFESSRGVETVK